MKQMIKNTLILAAITLIAGVLLGFVFEITKEPIAKAKEAAKKEAYQKVMADANEFDSKEYEDFIYKDGIVIDEVVEAKKDDALKGYVITVTTNNGYGGAIQIAVGISSETSQVKGVEVLSISETAGLGMNAQKEEFRSQYVDKEISGSGYVVTKNGAQTPAEIDAISGATITSKAVTDAVNMAVAYYHLELGGGANE